MVKRRELEPELRNLHFTPEMLRSEWKKFHDMIKDLVPEYTNDSVIALMQYIMAKDYAGKFYPGISLGTLLISKPVAGIVNYQKTLSISIEENNPQINILKYSDWDLIDKEEDRQKAVIWTKECPANELLKNFEEFLDWNKDWKE